MKKQMSKVPGVMVEGNGNAQLEIEVTWEKRAFSSNICVLAIN